MSARQQKELAAKRLSELFAQEEEVRDGSAEVLSGSTVA